MTGGRGDGNARFVIALLPAALGALALCAFGLAFIYSTGYIGDDYPVRENWIRQAFFLLAGAVFCAIAAKTDYRGRVFKFAAISGYVVSIVMLVLILVIGRTSGGARRWLAIGGMTIQPAEFAKVFTILVCAYLNYMAKRWYQALPSVVLATVIPCMLILAEPSYGNAFSLVAPVVALTLMRWHGGMSFAVLLSLAFACIALSLAGLLWARSSDGTAFFDSVAARGSYGLRDYHLRRIRSYIDPHGGWNERQSIVTVASGGPYGKGYLQGTMKGLGFLPRTVAPSDFIFAVICEELGFWYGCLPVMLLYALLLIAVLYWGGRAGDSLGTMMCCGGAALLFTHVAVNVGMVVRLLPVIGLPLPLLSYGGSYAMATLLLLGAMASVPLHALRNDDAKGKSSD
ncbi:MAG: FtsW/RodA/SpoVE family cell cycle protein, partial [Victivallales bacterium]|nr:FtsW/RodA/SpoVE family cell cycle protein [Victivallales bacterium]